MSIDETEGQRTEIQIIKRASYAVRVMMLWKSIDHRRCKMFAGLSNKEVGMALIRHEAGRVVLPGYMVEELKAEIEKRKAASRRTVH